MVNVFYNDACFFHLISLFFRVLPEFSLLFSGSFFYPESGKYEREYFFFDFSLFSWFFCAIFFYNTRAKPGEVHKHPGGFQCDQVF